MLNKKYLSQQATSVGLTCDTSPRQERSALTTEEDVMQRNRFLN